MKRKGLWNFGLVVIGLIILITYTPLVTPAGVHDPFFLGMPYTLWLGIFITLFIVILIGMGTQTHPGRKE